MGNYRDVKTGAVVNVTDEKNFQFPTTGAKMLLKCRPPIAKEIKTDWMLVTTSRYVSTNTRQFAKKMAEASGSRYVSRGKKTVDSLAEYSRRVGEERVCIITERKKEPHEMKFIEIKHDCSWKWMQKLMI